MTLSKKDNTYCSVGICAHNEENNIGKLLQSILRQKIDPNIKLGEIIVVSSASTDKTDEIVKKWRQKNRNIKLIIQEKRLGKASAVNIFIHEAKYPILILVSADVLLKQNCLNILIRSLKPKSIGLTSPRIIPQNSDKSLVSFAVHLQWRLHHRINLQFPERPKVGELIVFKKIFQCIPKSTAVDEASVEPLIYLQGYEIKYCPEAIIYNKGPESIIEFLSQRRRIYAGHTALRHRYGYSVITYSNVRLLGALLTNLDWNWRFFLLTPLVIALEAIGRLIGYTDWRFKVRDHTVWKIAKTTKMLK